MLSSPRSDGGQVVQAGPATWCHNSDRGHQLRRGRGAGAAGKRRSEGQEETRWELPGPVTNLVGRQALSS